MDVAQASFSLAITLIFHPISLIASNALHGVCGLREFDQRTNAIRRLFGQQRELELMSEAAEPSRKRTAPLTISVDLTVSKRAVRVHSFARWLRVSFLHWCCLLLGARKMSIRTSAHLSRHSLLTVSNGCVRNVSTSMILNRESTN